MKWLIFLFATSLWGSNCCPPGALAAPSCNCKNYTGIEGRLFSATPCIDQPAEPCGMLFIADVSLLAWQAIEEGLCFALKNDPLPIPSNVNLNGKLIAPDFSWEPAVKGTIGMIFSERAWDAEFRWTYFHSNSSRSINAAAVANSAGLIPLWAFPNANRATQFLYGSAKGALEFDFNGFDIEMGYNPFLSPWLSCRFVAGLKVAQINQDFHVRYSDGFNDGTIQLVNANADLSNHAIGTGPRLGFESKWRLGEGISLLGSIAGSLPLWHFRVGRSDTDLNLDLGTNQLIDATFRERFWIFRSILETSLGFGWDTCFGCRCQYPFGIHASYEIQYYAEQNMMAMLVNPGLLSQAFKPRGDLVLHGATFTFHIGF